MSLHRWAAVERRLQRNLSASNRLEWDVAELAMAVRAIFSDACERFIQFVSLHRTRAAFEQQRLSLLSVGLGFLQQAAERFGFFRDGFES